MVTVPAVFFGNPRPLTVSVEPAGPVFGLSERVVALDAADALGAAPMAADVVRTVTNITKPATAFRI